MIAHKNPQVPLFEKESVTDFVSSLLALTWDYSCIRSAYCEQYLIEYNDGKYSEASKSPTFFSRRNIGKLQFLLTVLLALYLINAIIGQCGLGSIL
jgi:hypothetical protein